MEIRIEKLSPEKIRDMGIEEWPIWEKEISVFDWYYDSREKCLFLQGKVIVKTANATVEINAGDFVTFPKGLHCVWEVIEPVRKYYQFD